MISIPDIAVISAIALLVFGPEQLPKVMRKAGQVMRDVQNTSQSFIREMERAADDTPPYTPPPYEPPTYEPYVANDDDINYVIPPAEPEATQAIDILAEAADAAAAEHAVLAAPAVEPVEPVERVADPAAIAEAAPEIPSHAS